MLGCAAPSPPYVRPRHQDAVTRWSDGTWRRCRIMAWDRTEPGYKHLLTEPRFDCFVFIKFPEGMASDDGWSCFQSDLLRVVRD
jgi:hypothetical protein